MRFHNVSRHGWKTVISIVLQILKTISDGDHLDSRRCLILDGSLIFFTTNPPTTGYHSVRISIPLHTIYTTTTLNRTTTLSLLNKNTALEILFIQSPVNAIFMMEEMESRTAGTSMQKKKRNLKCWNASVVIIHIHSDTEKARESQICITGNACDLLFYLGSTYRQFRK